MAALFVLAFLDPISINNLRLRPLSYHLNRWYLPRWGARSPSAVNVGKWFHSLHLNERFMLQGISKPLDTMFLSMWLWNWNRLPSDKPLRFTPLLDLIAWKTPWFLSVRVLPCPMSYPWCNANKVQVEKNTVRVQQSKHKHFLQKLISVIHCQLSLLCCDTIDRYGRLEKFIRTQYAICI